MGEEGPHRPEASAAVGLKVEREGGDLADHRNPEEPLDIGVEHEHGMELLLDARDLPREERCLLHVELGLEARERRQGGGRVHVVLHEQPTYGVRAARALGHEHQALAQQVARLTELGTDPVRGGDEVTAELLRGCGRVDRVGLHLRAALQDASCDARATVRALRPTPGGRRPG